jgi:hypothetical protein
MVDGIDLVPGYQFRKSLPIPAIDNMERTTLDQFGIYIITDISKHYMGVPVQLAQSDSYLGTQLSQGPYYQDILHGIAPPWGIP